MSVDKQIANRILEQSLIVYSADHGYFSRALATVSVFIDEDAESVYTDGKSIGVNSEYLLSHVAEAGNFDLQFTHLLLHDLFLHPFENVSDDDFDLACDITVGYITDEMKLYAFADKKYTTRKSAYKSIIDKFDALNEKVASAWLADKKEEEKTRLKEAFKICDHTAWKKNEEQSGVQSDIDGDGDKDADQRQKWKEIAVGLLKNLSPDYRSLKKLLKAKTVDADYLSVIKRFLFSSERLKTDPEQFDYIYYCLGLERYGNMPLIENLEYREDKNFKDVVLAVDTSGSTKGEPIARFIDEIYSLVKAASASGEKYRLRIIQCDCKITDDIIVESEERFEEIMKNFEVKGGGGTDFRPVFDLLDLDLKRGRKTKALVYFTDGFGIFPDKDVGIKTCFALYGEKSENIKVPYFAYKIEIGGEYL
ncbi:MAG: hypothetical protein IJ800_01955 [Clostridia bacterium]|nr:hypothetical protein [Clostridia bacterium]